ncbi:TadE/TadG family type IV pilus assembly protein [Pararhodobacter sp.]|uniref:TadE/TadG family type IV pilus assembly protein n=1 Tax=Pararhodobacter sp. TaxID=2127056 RepID=UPI002AFEC3BE|nr:TadE/TadG family type IV pilus assembly protein [Pararhodobacter sp.]
MGFLRRLARFLHRDQGTATVEFVIAVPLVLAFLFSSIDFGVVMLRQVFLDRSVDMAVRQVRLGNVPSGGFDAFKQMICDDTFLIPNCMSSISVEMRPIDTATWAGLDTPAQCINREQNIAPSLQFNPGNGGQELMLIRVCIVADPFLEMTGMVLGMRLDASGGYHIVSHAAFANEPI